MIKKIIYNILRDLRPSKYQSKKNKIKFPFVHTKNISGYKDGIKFEINNPVESFRIVDWGGEQEYVEYVLKHLINDDVFLDRLETQ
jgi:hypothetical protein